MILETEALKWDKTTMLPRQLNSVLLRFKVGSDRHESSLALIKLSSENLFYIPNGNNCCGDGAHSCHIQQSADI